MYLYDKGGIIIFQNTFKALSDPTRREILNILRNGKASVGEIASHFNTTQATISHHLSVLKKANLIVESKEWKYVYFELNISIFEELILWLSLFKKKEMY